MTIRPLSANGIPNIVVMDPLVRLELLVLQTTTTDAQKPRRVHCETIMMPLDGFAVSIGMMEALMKKLLYGRVRKRIPDAAKSAKVKMD